MSERPARRRAGLVGPFSTRQVLLVALAAAGAALFAAALNAPIVGPGPPGLPDPRSSFYPVGAPREGPQVGQPAPELEGVVDRRTVGLTDLDGRPIRLADLRGRPVWLNFWATWCPPCQAETPTLRDAYERHRAEGLALVAVAVQETTVEDVRAYARSYGLGYTIGFDAESAIFRRYGIFGLPTHFFIDRDGVVRRVILGPVSADQAERYVGEILGP